MTIPSPCALSSSLEQSVTDLSPSHLMGPCFPNASPPHRETWRQGALTTPLTLQRRGVELKLLAGKVVPASDPALRKALGDAHRWAMAIQSGTPLHDVTRTAGHRESQIRTRTPFAFVSPRIQCAILEGTQPVDLTLEYLVRRTLPLDWASQERLCGI